MALIKSISGIRGTIGGNEGDGLSPGEIVKYTSAFCAWIQQNQKPSEKGKKKIIIGRDARLSGSFVMDIVRGTIIACGIDVIDLGMAATPTVEMAVPIEKAAGGIIITASHNPKNWNALKLLNSSGEFLSESSGNEVLSLADGHDAFGSGTKGKKRERYASVQGLGTLSRKNSYTQLHIEKILALPWVDTKAIRAKKFRVAVDAVNSVGGYSVPLLLRHLMVDSVVEVFCEPTGNFGHGAEPLPENLTELCKTVVKSKAHVGFAVDPDVDRLAIVNEDGEPFGEEYTLVAIADYVLKHKKGNTVSNLSSTRALRDVTEKAGGRYFASAVGEVNVVESMKKHNAVIGGEGNGGVILPDLHYGRDALLGIALFLTHLAKYGKSCSMLRSTYPKYFISKNKIDLSPGINVDKVISGIRDKYRKYPCNTIDGLKIELGTEWAHIRKSNTEPIIRIITESSSRTTADNLAKKILLDIGEQVKASK